MGNIPNFPMGQEVVSCIDFSQFDGKSPSQCGPAAVVDAWGMVQKGETPTLSPGDAQAKMDSLYTQFIGPDVPSDWNGTDMATLYKLIGAVGGHWQNLFPDGRIPQSRLKDTIRAWVKLGFSVIIAMTEVSVTDMGLNENPYSWVRSGALTGLNHIINITGLSSSGLDFLVRDTANPNKGPRLYAATPMELISATVYIHPWQLAPRPPDEYPDHYVTLLQGAQPNPQPQPQATEFSDTWNLTGLSLPMGTGIANAWVRAWKTNSHCFGPPVTREVTQHRADGTAIVVQEFLHARAEWDGTGASWYDGRGLIGKF